jgi:hypothetical protein
MEQDHNLTAIRESGRMVTHHLLDALAVLPQLPRQDTCACSTSVPAAAFWVAVCNRPAGLAIDARRLQP